MSAIRIKKSHLKDLIREILAEQMSPADDADRFCTSCDGAFHSDDPSTIGGTACPNCGTETLVYMDDDLRRRARASETF